MGGRRIGDEEIRGAAELERMHAQVLLRADGGEGGPGWTDVRIAEALRVGVRTVESISHETVRQAMKKTS